MNLSPASTLSLAYFAYFAVLGVFVPYIGLFLDGRGLNSHDIGVLLAIVTGMRIVGPSLWAALALKKRDPIGVMRLGAVLASLGWLSSFRFRCCFGLRGWRCLGFFGCAGDGGCGALVFLCIHFDREELAWRCAFADGVENTLQIWNFIEKRF